MREKIIICQRCGKEFTIHGPNGKFCADCKKLARREQMRIRYRAENVSMSDDTEEMRNCCLTCKRPSCPGQCERLADVVRGMKHES